MTAPSKCYQCGQPDPVQLKHLLRWEAPTARWVPGMVWVRFIIRACWEKPNCKLLVRGIVRRYAAGPFLVVTMPERKEQS